MCSYTRPFNLQLFCNCSRQDFARHLIQETLSTCRGPNTEHVVRVNGNDSGLLGADLKAVFGGNPPPNKLPDALMLPKVESVEHLQQVGNSVPHDFSA